MKLTDIIEYLISPERLGELFQEQGLDNESEVLLIYMKERLAIDSDIAVFKIEETEDDQVFDQGGIQYVQLFPVDYAIQLIEYDLNLKAKGHSNLEIAKKLLNYRHNDA
jgi:hypothetical protein